MHILVYSMGAKATRQKAALHCAAHFLSRGNLKNLMPRSKVKSNYFIVRPKVDQRTGLLSLPHLGNFRRTHAHHICLYFVSIHQRATTGAQRCALLVRLLTTHLPTPEGWKAELA